MSQKDVITEVLRKENDPSLLVHYNEQWVPLINRGLTAGELGQFKFWLRTNVADLKLRDTFDDERIRDRLVYDSYIWFSYHEKDSGDWGFPHLCCLEEKPCDYHKHNRGRKPFDPLSQKPI